MDLIKMFVTLAILSIVVPGAVQAQITGADISATPMSGANYLLLGGTTEPDSLSCYLPSGFCANAKGVNFDLIARAPDVAAQFADLNSRVSAIDGRVSNFLATQNYVNTKVFDLIAVSSALKDAVPNDGDRFAVRLNMGGFGSNFAGGVSASVNLDESFRVSASYGQGRSQSAFSAGLNFSFN